MASTTAADEDAAQPEVGDDAAATLEDRPEDDSTSYPPDDTFVAETEAADPEDEAVSQLPHETPLDDAESSPRAHLEDAALRLAAMVRPAPGEPAVALQEIWDKVVKEMVCLPGDWNTTVKGALDAARVGDWLLCTYLAARCYAIAEKRGPGAGAVALGETDERCLRTLWLQAAVPVVVDVPLGQERVCVCLGGAWEWVGTDELVDTVPWRDSVTIRGRGRALLSHGPFGSAEHFNPGRTLELSHLQWQKPRFRRLLLDEEGLLEAQQALMPGLGAIGGAAVANGCRERAAPRFMAGEGQRLAHVSGCRFRVLAYPFVGDLTKALLRPAVRSWTSAQRAAAADAIASLGETLVSQCAKAGQWDLAALLLRAGVAWPELAQEFEGTCGLGRTVRKQWLHDLMSAAGLRNAPSLLELAARTQIAARAAGDAGQPLVTLAEAMTGRAAPPELAGGPGGAPPLLVAVAEAADWNAVLALLELPEGLCVHAAELLISEAAGSLPEELRERAAVRAQCEDAVSTPKSVGDYFSRLLAGDVLGDSLVPPGFSLREGVLVNQENSVRVLAHGLWLGGHQVPGAGAVLAFVAISPGELEHAATAAVKAKCHLLPLDLTSLPATLSDPKGGDGRHCWLAVLCPEGYLGAGPKGLIVQAPRHCIPVPHVLQRCPVEVLTLTPCCRKPLGGVPVLLAGKRVAVTGSDGRARLQLPPGRHSLGVPGAARSEVAEVQPDSKAVEVKLRTAGELFLCLRDNTFEDKVKDAVVLCAKLADVVDFKPFRGTVSIGGRRVPPGGIVDVEGGRPCQESLQDLTVESLDGRPFEPSEDFGRWLHEMSAECPLQLLYNNPQTLGNLLGSSSGTTAGCQRTAHVVGESFSYSEASITIQLGQGSLRARARASSAGRLPRPHAEPLNVGRWSERPSARPCGLGRSTGPCRGASGTPSMSRWAAPRRLGPAALR